MAAVILITGAPASGKTALARTLADRLDLPILAKDRIKETLFDALPLAGNWSKPLGSASYELLLHLVEELARGRGAFIVENAFRATDGPALRRRLAGADVLHIHCEAAADTLVERMRRRTAAGERHPSHHHAGVPALIASGVYRAPSMNGDPLLVPTDDFGSARYRRAVAVALNRAGELVQLAHS